MDTAFQLYVGIDWAKEDYQISVVDPGGKTISSRKVLHEGKALQEFADWLATLSNPNPAATAIGIEVPRGAIVELLLDRGFSVFSINPKQMDRFRDRHNVGGAKSDPFDAYVIADSLRTDQHLFRSLGLDDADTVRLRELSRTDEELQQEFHRVLNRICEQLHRYYPQLLALCPSAEEEWLWSLWQIAALPAQGAKLSPSRLEKLLKRHRIRKISAANLIEKLRTPALPVAPGVAEAAAEHLAVLFPQARLLRDQRRQLQRTMSALLETLSQSATGSSLQPEAGQSEEGESTSEQIQEHRDARIVLSLPGIGTTIGATMLAEASQALRQREYHGLRGYSGVAPVTKKSGRQKTVMMRRACNVRLRNAIHNWAMNLLAKDDRSYDHYRKLRAAGHSHGRALRGIADRWLSVLISMLKHRRLFDPARWQPVSPPLN